MTVQIKQTNQNNSKIKLKAYYEVNINVDNKIKCIQKERPDEKVKN